VPLPSGDLTRGEQAFVAAYADTGDRAKAEKLAGIPAGTGYRIMARPEIAKRITERQTARITCELLPIAVDTLLDVMTNAKSPAAARVQAAKIVIDRALPVDDRGVPKDLAEMTPEELAQAISTMEGMAAAMAKPVPNGGIFD
jgi:hypothetical protein